MITDARYANIDGTAVVIETTTDGSVAISELDRPDLWSEFLTWAASNTAAAYVASAPTFLAREFLAELTEADGVLVRAAIAGNAGFWLLWQAMTGQGDAPIRTDSDRFVAGWAGIRTVLGEPRALQIADVLGI